MYQSAVKVFEGQRSIQHNKIPKLISTFFSTVKPIEYWSLQIFEEMIQNGIRDPLFIVFTLSKPLKESLLLKNTISVHINSITNLHKVAKEVHALHYYNLNEWC